MTGFLLQLLLTVLLSDVCRADSNLRGIDKSQDTHVYRDGIPHLTTRTDIIKQTALLPTHVHEVIFAVEQNNMDVLERILNDVSDPSSANYGQHMSGEQVAALTMNPEARDAVINYLYANGASVTAESLNGEFITANAPISLWNKVFNTEFNLFHQRQVDGDIVQKVRAETFSIPKELDEHVFGVINVIEMPFISSKKTNIIEPPKEVIDGMGRALAGSVYNGWVLPRILRAAYNSSGVNGNSLSTQCAYSANDDYFNRVDLAKFQAADNINMNQPALEMNGHVVNQASEMNGGDWTEGNLDVQYLMAMSPGSPSSYWWWHNEMATWLTSLTFVVEVPLVLSISYGAAEIYTPKWEHDLFTREAMKLSVRGVTILAASGDDGAVSWDARNDPSKCAYRPLFPAGNPFVVGIGATKGIEWGRKEFVCSSATGGSITSGGGFSNYYPQPEWQKTTIDSYFETAARENKVPLPGFNRQGRGYPDLAVAGANYLIMVGGSWGGVAGTSASCPVAAGLFSNINAARMAIGKGALGWMNPTLYAKAHLFTNDVVTGDNKCPWGRTCCTEGYSAVTGWDPATGFGSVDYIKMQAVFLSLGKTNFMTYKPSPAPSFAQPSSRPTWPDQFPTYYPSRKPTLKPTVPPTTKPSSSKPSLKPTLTPSNAFNFIPTDKPTPAPTNAPIAAPTPIPTPLPSSIPTTIPTFKPTPLPSSIPTAIPTFKPTSLPTSLPSAVPSGKPNFAPTSLPTPLPSAVPTPVPTSDPSNMPSAVPSDKPTSVPTSIPTTIPSEKPSTIPSVQPTPTPSLKPSTRPTVMPSATPISSPSAVPNNTPTVRPTQAPTFVRTPRPSKKPNTSKPTKRPTTTTLRPTATKVFITSGSAAPSSTPELSISASLNVLQTADDSFVNALTDTLVALLGEGTAVTDVTLSHPGRRLLANQALKYTITQTNGMTTEDIIDVLKEATDSGDFYKSFSKNAGVLMTGVKNLQAVDVTPTAAPTSSPKTVVEEYTGTVSTAAVAGGCIGGILIALAVSYYLYKKKTEKPIPPTIYMHNDNDGGDFIPITADTMTITQQAKEDKKCDFATIYPNTD